VGSREEAGFGIISRDYEYGKKGIGLPNCDFINTK
jgi:hypothetical protein